ncbi:MAG TPA: hypothetical protein DIW44_03130 [Anaerolineaceae bacterium]|nr:hypothetical protein [Anaerolineaceae bacterium]
MRRLLSEDRFDFVSAENKSFMLAFDEEISRLGYGFGGKIGEGFCWGRFMVLYRKSGVKSQTVYARLYIREMDIVLRLFLNQVDKHREFIENAREYIKTVFTGPRGNCEHCHNDKDGVCKFRKSYTLENRLIEKCNGIVFEFFEPDTSKLKEYMALFTEFFPGRR